MKNYFLVCLVVFATLIVLLWLADDESDVLDGDTSQVLLIASNLLLTIGICSLVQFQFCCDWNEDDDGDSSVDGEMAELNEVQVTVNVKMDLKERRSEFHQYRVSELFNIYFQMLIWYIQKTCFFK